MWLFGLAPKSRSKVKRRDDRFSTDMLTTPLGKVKDLSVGGVRISGKGRTLLSRGQVIPMKLQNSQHVLKFTGRIAWIKHTRKGFEAGIQLLDVKPHIARILRSLGQLGFIPVSNTSISDDGRGFPPVVLAPDDPYVILGLEASATDEQIQKAYRLLARKYHPDANSSPDAADRFARITEAHRTLQRRRLRVA